MQSPRWQRTSWKRQFGDFDGLVKGYTRYLDVDVPLRYGAITVFMDKQGHVHLSPRRRDLPRASKTTRRFILKRPLKVSAVGKRLYVYK